MSSFKHAFRYNFFPFVLFANTFMQSTVIITMYSNYNFSFIYIINNNLYNLQHPTPTIVYFFFCVPSNFFEQLFFLNLQKTFIFLYKKGKNLYMLQINVIPFFLRNRIQKLKIGLKGNSQPGIYSPPFFEKM